jgi:hypothetical protein
MFTTKLIRQPTSLKALPKLLCNPRYVTTAHSKGLDPQALLQDKRDGLGFIRSNPLPLKPRQLAVTEIRGPYYSAYGRRHLEDVLETTGHYVDGLKFAGGSFALFPEARVREMIDTAHAHQVYVSTVGLHMDLLFCGRD